MDNLVLSGTRRTPPRTTATDKYRDWVRLMRHGLFDRAWTISDEIVSNYSPTQNRGRPLYEQIVWNGDPLDGRRVLVRCYHGLGDTIQFSRFIPMVKQIAAETTVELPKPLVDLFSGASWMSGVHLSTAVESGADEIEAEIMELAHIFRIGEGTIPDIPHLSVCPEPIARDRRLAVGIVWKAVEWDDRRSLDLKHLWPLRTVPGVSFHSLQIDPYSAGWSDDFGTALDAKGILRTAQLIEAMDLIITVDTMTAHLAGTLRKPVWTLLQADADWRWMLDRQDSPWYPTMLLFRQQTQGDWGSVIESVSSELRRLANQRSDGSKSRAWGAARGDSSFGQPFL